MSIKPEIIKLLKQNGFPQGDDIMYIPRLDELILGCGKFFFRLERKSENEWESTAKVPENKMCPTCPKGEQVVVMKAESAEEAMSLLWIRLKKW